MKKWIWLFLLCLFFLPVCGKADELIPNAKSGILMEVGSGKIIFEKNPHEQVSVASLTKMVVQIIILEEIEKGSIHWGDMVIVSRNASNITPK